MAIFGAILTFLSPVSCSMPMLPEQLDDCGYFLFNPQEGLLPAGLSSSQQKGKYC